jgi:polyhydroxybutyrate depolymerase
MYNVQGFSRMNPVSDANDFVVCYPQGAGIAPPGFSWADGRNTSADQLGIDDVGFVNALVRVLIPAYTIDPRRIYLCGFSNGGFMVQRIACEAPDMFAAMASLGSSMDTILYRSCRPTRSIPMAFMNGTSDPAMPYEGGVMQNPQVLPVVPVDSVVRRWVTHNRCRTEVDVLRVPDVVAADNSTVDVYRYTDCECAADVAFYHILNGGHTWPGVLIEAQSSILGPTNLDISGSDELWGFFRSFELCDEATSVPDPEASTVGIHPSPTRSVITITGIGVAGSSVRIHDGLGREVRFTRGCTLIDVSDLRSGVYVVLIESQGQLQVRTIIKQD